MGWWRVSRVSARVDSGVETSGLPSAGIFPYRMTPAPEEEGENAASIVQESPIDDFYISGRHSTLAESIMNNLFRLKCEKWENYGRIMGESQMSNDCGVCASRDAPDSFLMAWIECR